MGNKTIEKRIKSRHAYMALPVSLCRQAGLTLVELLVAISVLAFVAVLGWRGLDGIVRARVALTDDLEQTRGMQLAFAQLQNDCAHIVNASNMPGRVPLVIDQDRLLLIRTVFADNQPSRLQVVTYRVRNGVLTRQESAATRDLNELDDLLAGAARDADKTQEVTLQSGVHAMTMRLWDGNGWREPNVNAEPASGSAGANPANPAAGQKSGVPLVTGLEVALQLQGREGAAPMLKVFLLGAV
jgi:general secretion pathway protein J